jgi:RimJ/RimL family protein N-acetyltransferase
MSNPPFHITTPRLFISHQNPLNNTHCDFAVTLLHSTTSMKHNPSGPSLVPDRSAARSLIANSTEKLQQTGYGRYLVSLKPQVSDEKENGEDSSFLEPEHDLIGYVSCQFQRHAATPGPLIPDIGFNFLEEYHGRGYAKEAVEGLMTYFREKGTKAFAAMTDDENVDAKRLLARLGFRDWGVRRVVGVVNGGKEEELSVWTVGVENEGVLEENGFGKGV